MNTHTIKLLMAMLLLPLFTYAQIGKRFPSERKVIKDPKTGIELVFLTTQEGKGDRKIYPTHNQWTSDGKWLIFSSQRVLGEAIAVNEKTGVMVQVTEGGYMGQLNISYKNMKMYFMRPYRSMRIDAPQIVETTEDSIKTRRPRGDGRVEIIEVDLATVFAHSEKGQMKEASYYQRVCGVTPREVGASGDMALDANEQVVYFRIGKDYASSIIDPSIPIEKTFGPRNMGAGPSGIAMMDLRNGETRPVVAVPFQVGHIQTNPWVEGEIVFCWETGGKAPQRTWSVRSDGTNLRPLFKETEFDWVTHEAVITKDEVAMAVLGHRPVKQGGDKKKDATNPGQEALWGPSGTRAHPGGLLIYNLRSDEVYIAGQIKNGSGFWHVHGSHDGRFAVGDDFARDLWLIDRQTNEMRLLTSGHKPTAKDHPHPTFSPDGTKIQIQSAMLSKDDQSLNICVIHIPKKWLK